MRIINVYSGGKPFNPMADYFSQGDRQLKEAIIVLEDIGYFITRPEKTYNIYRDKEYVKADITREEVIAFAKRLDKQRVFW